MALGRKSVALSQHAEPANQETDDDRCKHHSRQHKPTFDFPSELCGLVGTASHVAVIPYLEETAGRPEGLMLKAALTATNEGPIAAARRYQKGGCRYNLAKILGNVTASCDGACRRGFSGSPAIWPRPQTGFGLALDRLTLIHVSWDRVAQTSGALPSRHCRIRGIHRVGCRDDLTEASESVACTKKLPYRAS
jgi:hypothetical protein